MPTLRLLRAICAAAGLAAAIGCAPWKAEPAKYETVPTSNRHDTKTAKKKHAEALKTLEDPAGPFSRFVHLDPTTDPAAAAEQLRQKHIAKAEGLLNEALVADVTYGPAHNSLGMVYYAQNKLYLAAWEFEYAAKLMPDLAEPYNNLGLVYERAGKYEDAISYFSMALSRDANDPKVIGNLVRARLITGDKSGDLKTMISDLALYHPDPGWQEWARDQVELGKFDETSLRPSSAAPPEVMPSPMREPELLEPELAFPDGVLPSEG
jgi:tetratricopeptide (TPR) repeat protein